MYISLAVLHTYSDCSLFINLLCQGKTTSVNTKHTGHLWSPFTAVVLRGWLVYTNSMLHMRKTFM